MHHSRLAGFVIDCRTDDLDDAARFWIAALGATRVQKIRTFWVMQSPTGQRFCVVRARHELAGRAGANAWP